MSVGWLNGGGAEASGPLTGGPGRISVTVGVVEISQIPAHEWEQWVEETGSFSTSMNRQWGWGHCPGR